LFSCPERNVSEKKPLVHDEPFSRKPIYCYFPQGTTYAAYLFREMVFMTD
jgi:hypothetical protein